MKISDLDTNGLVYPDLHCQKCGEPFGDLWKHTKKCEGISN